MFPLRYPPLLSFIAALVLSHVLRASESMDGVFAAKTSGGSIISFDHSSGQRFIEPGPGVSGASITKISGVDRALSGDAVDLPGSEKGAVELEYALPAGRVFAAFSRDGDSGDLLISHRAQSEVTPIKKIGWSLGYIPLEMNIIIPGAGGVRLTQDSPESAWSFSYPMGWEAQLVIVEGEGRGFYVWSDDSQARFKGVSIKRTQDGWVLEFSTENYAPYDGKLLCESVQWRLNEYTGDWRDAAAVYREWSSVAFGAKPLHEQKPSWVGSVRTVVYGGQDIDRLETLSRVVDAKQSLLYLHHWRAQEFDRGYPNYSEYADGIRAFVKRAHELGFRIMLHLNMKGCDVNDPLFEQLKPYQIRSSVPPFEARRYLNTRVSPPIEIAYINPASELWRKIFITRAVALVEDLNVDALHLDQNFHAFNDNNGLIDGLTMNEGVIRLHRELRDALPNVALSGEGINELTYPFMAYAQRHVYSAMKRTIDRSSLMDAHPVSSYLFLPYTRLYGWLGIPAGNEQPQAYAAWMENLRLWGVQPTPKLIRQTKQEMLNPNGFLRQNLEEVRFWQRMQVEPDMDGSWPSEVAFPWKTSQGRQVLVGADRSTNFQGHEISKTISDVTSTRLPGTIPDWLLYNDESIFGLDPSFWYPYFDEERPMGQFHISALENGFTVSDLSFESDRFGVTVVQRGGVLVDLSNLLRKAATGVRLTGGAHHSRTGAFTGLNAASVSGAAGVIRMSPPAAREMTTDFESDAVPQSIGLGEVYATFEFELPQVHQAVFRAEVGMDGRSIGGAGLSDGVEFSVIARSGALRRRVSVNHAAIIEKLPIHMDLRGFHGAVQVDLIVSPGSANNATEDRALWYLPRIEEDLSTSAGVLVVDNAPAWFESAAREAGVLSPSNDSAGSSVTIKFEMPGSIELNGSR